MEAEDRGASSRIGLSLKKEKNHAPLNKHPWLFACATVFIRTEQGRCAMRHRDAAAVRRSYFLTGPYLPDMRFESFLRPKANPALVALTRMGPARGILDLKETLHWAMQPSGLGVIFTSPL